MTLDRSVGTYDELRRRALIVNLFGFDCAVLSLEDLIAVKQKMKRPKDLIVLEELLEIKRQKATSS